MLGHTATHCNTLQDTEHTALYCNTLNTLQHTAAHCNTMQHTNADTNTHNCRKERCHHERWVSRGFPSSRSTRSRCNLPTHHVLHVYRLSMCLCHMSVACLLSVNVSQSRKSVSHVCHMPVACMLSVNVSLSHVYYMSAVCRCVSVARLSRMSVACLSRMSDAHVCRMSIALKNISICLSFYWICPYV